MMNGRDMLPVSPAGNPKKPKLGPTLVYVVGAATVIVTFLLVRWGLRLL